MICRGIPLKVKNDPSRLGSTLRFARKVKVNRAAVDSELALMAYPWHPLVGFVRNSLFRQSSSAAIFGKQVIKVSRLDGSILEASRSLIERALIAEKQGLWGRTYIDMGGRSSRRGVVGADSGTAENPGL